MLLEWLYGLDMGILYPAIIVVIVGASELGGWIGRRSRGTGKEHANVGTVTGATLGLVALLLAFTFSIGLARFDVRRHLVLEEANAIGSAANFALMLPGPVQEPILDMLRDYTAVRIGLDIPFNVEKMKRDIAQSLDLQNRLWQQAVALTVADPQSLPVYRFVGSLNEINNLHEKRFAALRYRGPVEVMFMLLGISMVAIALTGYGGGVSGSRRRGVTWAISLTIVVLIMMIVDLDRPSRGLIQVPIQPLIDAAQGIPKPMAR